jgi:hypothetical protein
VTSAACGVANSMGSGFVVEIRHVSVGSKKNVLFFGTAQLSEFTGIHMHRLQPSLVVTLGTKVES